MLKKGVRLVILLTILLLLFLSVVSSQDATPQVKVHPDTEQLLLQHEKIPVLIKLRESHDRRRVAIASVPEKRGTSKAEILEARKQKTREARESFRQAIAARSVQGESITIDYDFETIGVMALNVTHEQLELLKNNPVVESIAPQQERTISLAQSVSIIGADDVINLSVNNTNITGLNQVICVIDTGIQTDHEAFANKIVGGYDFVNNDNNPADDHGHGSHVSGIAAGNKTSATRVIGVAPDALIMPLKVCNAGGSCSDANILRGVEACVNNATNYNITAISGSLGGGGPYTASSCTTDVLYDSLEPFFTTALSLGIIPVFASGNNGFTSGVAYPACSPQVVSVGRTDKDDLIASSSNLGGDRLDVYAPGGSIVSAYSGSSTATATLSGTSMSTPHVSGAITLIQYNQRRQGLALLNLSAMRSLLNSTGKNVGSTSYRIDVLNAILKLNSNLTVNNSLQSVRNDTAGSLVQFRDTTDFGQTSSCIYLGNNIVSINSTRCPQFNKTAHIVLAGVSVPSRPLRDASACPDSACQNVTFANNSLEFDVISFSDYTSVPGCPVLLNASATLNESITANESCITFGASNIVFDCNGKTITWNTAGANNNHAILAANKTNVTIKNCIFQDGNETGMFGLAINLTNVTSSVLRNISIQVNGSTDNYGIVLQNSSADLLENISIKTNGSSNNHALVLLFTNSTIVHNITLRTNDTTGYALYLTSSTENHFSDMLFNGSLNWVSTSSGVNNLTNATFQSQNGSIRYPSALVLNGSVALSSTALAITYNRTLINTTLSVLNTSAQITLNTLPFTSPRAVASTTGDQPYSSCSACTNQSYSAGIYVFNITGSGVYAAAESQPSISITKTANMTSVIRGTQLNYSILVNNSGAGTAFNLTLVETYPSEITFNSAQPTPESNVTFSLGNLSGSTVFLVNISVNVSAGNAIGSALNNTAVLSYSTADGNSTINSSVLTTVHGTPGMITNVTDTPDPVVRGTVINYTVFLNNTGDDTAYNVTLLFTYPSNTTFVNSSPGATSNTTILLGNLSANQTMLVNITLNASTASNGSVLNANYNLVFENVLGVNSTVTNSTTTLVHGRPMLTLSATDTPDPLNAGDVLTYRITITNTGDEVAYNMTLVDTYPSNILFNNASPAASGNTTFALGSLVSNASTTVNITVNVSSSFTSGALSNSLSLTYANISGQNLTTTATQSTTVGSQSNSGGSGGSGGSSGAGGSSSGSSGSSSTSSTAASTAGAAESQAATGFASAFGGVGKSTSSTGKSSSSGSASAAASTAAGASAAGAGSTGLAIATEDTANLQLPALWKKVLPIAAVLVGLLVISAVFMAWRARRKKLPMAHIMANDKDLIPASQPLEAYEKTGTQGSNLCRLP
ncbi:MAG TPA: S8 family serine peptidase [Candidatus Nanoarchaeia archaeon]|nr:S8 family serine peptidase [Candidatus Nanoarchaeia archaeon]